MRRLAAILAALAFAAPASAGTDPLIRLFGQPTRHLKPQTHGKVTLLCDVWLFRNAIVERCFTELTPKTGLPKA